MRMMAALIILAVAGARSCGVIGPAAFVSSAEAQTVVQRPFAPPPDSHAEMPKLFTLPLQQVLGPSLRTFTDPLQLAKPPGLAERRGKRAPKAKAGGD